MIGGLILSAGTSVWAGGHGNGGNHGSSNHYQKQSCNGYENNDSHKSHSTYENHNVQENHNIGMHNEGSLKHMKESLFDLKAKDTITKQEAEKIEKYLNKEIGKINKMTSKEKVEYFEKKRTNKKDFVDDLIEEKIITEKIGKNIRTFMNGHNETNHVNHNNHNRDEYYNNNNNHDGNGKHM